jgi:hypothetical protein
MQRNRLTTGGIELLLVAGLLGACAPRAEAGAFAIGGGMQSNKSGGTNYIVHTFSTPGTYTFTVIAGGDAEIYAWGGGGSGGYNTGSGAGGGGAAARGRIMLATGTYSIVVGGGGASMAPGVSGTRPNGGGGMAGNAGHGGQGGGYSGIFSYSVAQSNALLIAGGGGGGAWEGAAGGAGGGTHGVAGGAGGVAGGAGGSQTAAGVGPDGTTAAGALLGGDCGASGDGGGGGGGGGGYWGGGAGSSVNPGSAGGGGSSYAHPARVTGAVVSGSDATPGDSSNPLRGSAGTGGASGNNAGGSGRVVVRYAAVAHGTQAEGGTVTTYSENGTNYAIHVFDAQGTTNLRVSIGGKFQVYAWGGGGGGGQSSGTGGGGGAAQGTLTAVPGTYAIVVGGGGDYRPAPGGVGTRPEGGGGFPGAIGGGGQGGGYSGIFAKSVAQSNALLIAGGGGGGGYAGNGGPGGGITTGSDGSGPNAGAGGSPTAGGMGAGGAGSGSALLGGDAGVAGDQGGGGGGGGGYFGGGAGFNGDNPPGNSGGGGGSGYCHPKLVSSVRLTPASESTPGDSTHPFRGGTAGNGGALNGAGSGGIVIVRYPAVAAIVNAAATDVTTGGATFNGWLVSTGAWATTVYVLWGEENGAATGRWAHTNWWKAGDWKSDTHPATNISLAPNRMYHYTFGAANATTNVAADAPVSFLTGAVGVKTSKRESSESSPADFIIFRPATATSGALAVNYTLAGTAINGRDYDRLDSPAIIPAGASEARLPVVPGFNFGDTRAKVVSLTIAPGAYAAGMQSNATIGTRAEAP